MPGVPRLELALIIAVVWAIASVIAAVSRPKKVKYLTVGSPRFVLGSAIDDKET